MKYIYILKILFLSFLMYLTAGCSDKDSIGVISDATPIMDHIEKATVSTTYYFSTFGSDSDQKLYIYTSSNGINFTQYYTGFSGPTGVLRDPSLLYYNSKYYIAFTTQSWTTSSTSFSIASSSDLKNWATIATVDCGIAGAQYTWAPDWYVENGVIRLIVSIGTSGAMKEYLFTAQNSTLTSWSGPVNMNLGTNYIDAVVVKSGSTYHCYSKNETTKNIEHFTASSITGSWTLKNTYWNGYEGVYVLQLPDGSWRMYVDCYSRGDGIYTATSSDLSTWSDLTKCGFGRHGSCIIKTTVSSSKLRNVSTGLYADGMGRTSEGSNAGQWASSTSNNQQWVIETSGSYVLIKNVATGLYLDGMGRTTNGSIVGQWGYSASINQQWTQETAGSFVKFKNLATGLYLDGMGSTANGSDLCQWSSSSSTNQQWQIE